MLPFLLTIRACLIAQFVAASLCTAQVLTHGPVVGGVTSSDAEVFVRTDQPASVVIGYSTHPDLSNELISVSMPTATNGDFTTMIPLTNLTAGTRYYLNVIVNGITQLPAPPYPAFTTFQPSNTTASFTFLVLTDFATAYKLTSNVQTYASAAALKPAFAFIGGDFDHRAPTTLADKRQMFKDLYNPQTPFMGDFVNLILETTAIVHQWDDHDSGMNNIDKNYPDWALSRQAYDEYVPSYPLSADALGIWQAFSYAQADFFLLDCRSQRDPDSDPDNADKSMLDGNNLGPRGQLFWLEQRLLLSKATWKIIFSSVITNPSTKLTDGWAAFHTEWEVLRQFINRNHVTGVVFISGDLHLSAIDNGEQSGFPEMCVAQPNSIIQTGRCATGRPGRWSEGYYEDTCNGFGAVAVLKNPDRLVLQAMDEFGNRQLSYTVPAPTSGGGGTGGGN